MTTAAVGRRAVLADLIPGTWVRDTALVVGGAALTGLAAQVSVHVPSITPVPFTLQTLTVLLTGATLGTVRGVTSMLLYLLAGVVGVPWYASHGSGFGGPSFGYIVGFVVAAGIVGELARRGNDRAVVSSVGLLMIGEAVILTIGTIWLSNDKHLAAEAAMRAGVYPFLVGDMLKLLLAALALPTAWRLVRR